MGQFLAFVVFAFNISVIGYLIYSWRTRNKPVLTYEEGVEKANQKRWARTPEENRKRDKRNERLFMLIAEPSMYVLYGFLFIILLIVVVVNSS